ncbi:MAG: energy-coupled thiamine transporter ThiT [Bacteroidales bacterium]|nr:energy-coupled thiamine transporter ThiT [Bacteroidales bacterium]
MSTNQEEQSKQEKQQTALEKKTQAKNNREMIMTVATGGICLAMSYALSLVKLFELPQGGTITPASMLPIIFFCLIFGAKKGFCVTFIYSLLQLIGGYFVHPAQVILDYTLAFTIIGVSGFFAASAKKRLEVKNPIRRLKLVPFWRIILAVVLAFALRCTCHVLSGVCFFAEYAGDKNVWVYSIVYNGSFLAVEAAITCIILVGVSVALGMVRLKAEN